MPVHQFHFDLRFSKLMAHIAEGKHIVISSIAFCDPEYLEECITILNNRGPKNIEHSKIYIENNLEKSIANIRKRDKEVRGGYWREDGRYVGILRDEEPLYRQEIWSG